MNIWRILGIEYTNDIKEIKKAYAKRSREVHPEDHPEEFRQLHDAYEQAMLIVKRNTLPSNENEGIDKKTDFDISREKKQKEILRESGNENDYENNIYFETVKKEFNEEELQKQKFLNGTESENDINFDYIMSLYEEQELKLIVDKTNIVIEKMEKLYKNSFTKYRTKKWSDCINSDEFKELIYYPYFIDKITKFLYSHTSLSNSVLNCIKEAFNISDLAEEKAKDIYAELFQICMGYDFFKQYNSDIEDIDRIKKYKIISLICLVINITAISFILKITTEPFQSITFSIIVLSFIAGSMSFLIFLMKYSKIKKIYKK